jgi:hypothetical protein
MSHVVLIKFKVEDLDCLEKAANALGLELVKDQKTYKWFGRWVGDYKMPEGMTAADLGKCDHVLRVKDNPHAYEVGIVARDKEYELLYDFWAGGHGLLLKIGQDAKDLRMRYDMETIKKDRIREGYRVWEEVNPKNMRPRLIAER